MKENNDKKYYILCSIILTILLIIVVTKGFNNTIILKIRNDSDYGIMDGFYTQIGIVFYNFLAVLLLDFLTIFITIKNKRMKHRKALLFSTIVISMFIPVVYVYRIGGIAGTVEENIYL